MNEPLERKGYNLQIELVRKHLKQVVLDYCEYSGINYPEVVNLVSKGSELARDEWICIVKTVSDQEVLDFYARSKYYIYEVLQPYLQPEKYKKDINYLKILRFAESLLKKGQYRVLDFGGGVGELCLLLAKIGCKVTYCDLPGEISKFAIWRFKKYNANIKIVWSRVNGIELPLRAYDLVVSDAVLEHLKREYNSYFIQAISNALVDNGYLYLLWDPTYSQDFPYHILGLKAKEMDRIFEELSLLRVSENLYVKSTSFFPYLRHLMWKCKAPYIRVRHLTREVLAKLFFTYR